MAGVRQARGAARGIGFTVVTRALDTVATWAFFVIASRTLGLERFGRFVFAVAVLQLGALVAKRGLDQALLVAPSKAVAHRFAYRQVAVSGAVVGAGALLYFFLGSADGGAAALILAVAIPLIALAQTAIGALRAEGKVVTAAVAEGVAQPAAALALSAVASFVAPTASGFAIAYAGSWVTPLLFATRLAWPADTLDPAAARHLLGVGRSMLTVALLSYATASADVILLGLFATAADLARYAVPQKITAVFLLVHSAVSAACGPFVRDAAGSPALLQRYYAMATRWALTLSLPLLVITAGAPPVILRLFGAEYAQSSGTVLVVLSFAALAYLVTGPIGTVLLCTHQAERLTRVTALHALFVVSGVAAGSGFGATGAAVGLLAGNATGRLVFAHAVRRFVHPLDSAVFSLLAIGAAGAVLLRVFAGRMHEAAAITLAVGTTAIMAAAVLHRTGDLRLLRMEFGRLAPSAEDGGMES